MNDIYSAIMHAANSSAFGLGATKLPTAAQKHAGNYRKGHVTYKGLPLVIEQPKGSYREGVGQDGKPWRNLMAAHYGYIAGTKGADGDEVDVFVGPATESETAYIINQIDPSTSKFDEHKICLGYPTEDAARSAYESSYDAGWKGLHSLVEVPLDGLREWLKSGDTTKAVDASTFRNGATMKTVAWNEDQPVGTTMADIIYHLRREDARTASLLDSATEDDVLGDSDGVMLLDAMVVLAGRLKQKMAQMEKVMTVAGTPAALSVVSTTVTQPFRQRGTVNVAVIFTLSDGQTITIFFHNPDMEPKRIQATDEVVSWKWLLNKRDITIVVAPEKGVDLNVRNVARRVMQLAAKNSPKFIQANADREVRTASIDGLHASIKERVERLGQQEDEIKGLKSELEARGATTEITFQNIKAALLPMGYRENNTGAMWKGYGNLSNGTAASIVTVRAVGGKDGVAMQMQVNQVYQQVNAATNRSELAHGGTSQNYSTFAEGMKAVTEIDHDIRPPYSTAAEDVPPEPVLALIPMPAPAGGHGSGENLRLGDIVSAKFAKFNKNNTLAEYYEQVAEGAFRVVKGKVEKVVVLTAAEFDQFADSLMSDRTDLGHGGGMTGDNGEFLEMLTVVKGDGRATVVVNASGYDYARYVGVDPVVISSTNVPRQVVDVPEGEAEPAPLAGEQQAEASQGQMGAAAQAAGSPAIPSLSPGVSGDSVEWKRGYRESEALSIKPDADGKYDYKAAQQALFGIRAFMPDSQYKALRDALNGEEGQGFAKMIVELAQRIANMPMSYDQDGEGENAIAYLHYFRGGADWYITEKDREGKGTEQAFGFANLMGDGELGYISIDELADHGVELDLHFTPQALNTINADSGPAPVSGVMTMGDGKGNLEDAVQIVGGKIGPWTPLDSATPWEAATYTSPGGKVTLRVAVSAGGVVQVEGDPFTPGDRLLNVSVENIVKSLHAHLPANMEVKPDFVVLRHDVFAEVPADVRTQMNMLEQKGIPAVLTNGPAMHYVLYTPGRRFLFDRAWKDEGSEASGIDVLAAALRVDPQASLVIAWTKAAQNAFDQKKAEDAARATREAKLAAQIERERAEREARINAEREKLRAILSAVKFKRGSIKLSMADGSEQLVKATLYGGLAVHKASSGYAITHPTTGLGVLHAFKTQAAAQMAAARLAMDGNFSAITTPEGIKEAGMELARAVAQAIASSDGDPLVQPGLDAELMKPPVEAQEVDKAALAVDGEIPTPVESEIPPAAPAPSEGSEQKDSKEITDFLTSVVDGSLKLLSTHLESRMATIPTEWANDAAVMDLYQQAQAAILARGAQAGAPESTQEAPVGSKDEHDMLTGEQIAQFRRAIAGDEDADMGPAPGSIVGTHETIEDFFKTQGRKLRKNGDRPAIPFELQNSEWGEIYRWEGVQKAKGKRRGDLYVMDFGNIRAAYFDGED